MSDNPIADNAADLVARVTSVPELTNSAGLAVGGRGNDPGLIKIPLPAAWVMFGKDMNEEDVPGSSPHGGFNMVGASTTVLATYSVLIYVPYLSQDDLLNVQFPLLLSVIRAIRGQEAPSGHRWRYTGQKLALVYPDRLAYEQHYTLTMEI